MLIGDLAILGLLIVAAVSVVAAVGHRRTAPGWTSSEWVAEHTTVSDRTVVAVTRKIGNADRSETKSVERREIGAIANNDPDYERKLLDLLETATNRAVFLNITPNG